MKMLSEIHNFTVHLVAPHKHFRWCIAMDGEVIHHIEHFKSFAENIDYPDILSEVIENHVTFDKVKSFIDFDDAESYRCTQNKIIDYLYKNCRQFKVKHADYYASMIEASKTRFENGFKRCANCFMPNELGS